MSSTGGRISTLSPCTLTAVEPGRAGCPCWAADGVWLVFGIFSVLPHVGQRAGRPASFAADGRAMQLLADSAAERPDDLALQGKLLTAHLEGGRKAAAG